MRVQLTYHTPFLLWSISHPSHEYLCRIWQGKWTGLKLALPPYKIVFSLSFPTTVQQDPLRLRQANRTRDILSRKKAPSEHLRRALNRALRYVYMWSWLTPGLVAWSRGTITNMAFSEPTEKKARLEKTNNGALDKDISSNVRRNQQNSFFEGDLRSLTEVSSAKTAVLQAVLADDYTRDFQTGSHLNSLPFSCNHPNLFLLIKC